MKIDFKVAKWYLIAIVLCVLIGLFLPLTVYEESGALSVILGTVLCSVFVLLGALGITNIREIFYVDFEEKNKDKTWLAIFLVSIPVLIVILYMFFSTRLNTAFEEEGVFAQATITGGSSTTTQSKSIRRSSTSTSFNLKVKFTDENGKKHSYHRDVDREVYKSVSKGLDLEVIYLTHNPSIFRIIAGDKNIKKYKRISNRNLNFEDLRFLVSLDAENGLAYLNKISVGWQETHGDGGIVYDNSQKATRILQKERMIAISGDKSVVESVEQSIPKAEIEDSFAITDKGVFGKEVKYILQDNWQVLSVSQSTIEENSHRIISDYSLVLYQEQEEE